MNYNWNFIDIYFFPLMEGNLVQIFEKIISWSLWLILWSMFTLTGMCFVFFLAITMGMNAYPPTASIVPVMGSPLSTLESQ